MGLDLLTDNPIFIRELRRRMRGRGLIITLCLYIAAMCLWALLTVQWESDKVAAQGFGVRAAGQRLGGATYTTATSIGQSLYASIVAIQMILVLIVAPTITAAMVRSEKERQTFDFLRGTAISASTYVVGALLSTLLYVALALLCGLPVLMISHLYGGVSDLLRTTGILLAMSVVLSSGGLLVSCATERGKSAHVPLALLLGGGLFALYGWEAVGGSWSAWMGGAAVSAGAAGYSTLTIPFWVTGLVASVIVSTVMLLVASRKLFQPTERALNYRQMGTLYLGGMLVAGGWLIAGRSAAGGQPTGASITSGVLNERTVFMIAVLIGLGILIQCVALMSRVEIGNERWRIRQRSGRSDSTDEAPLFVAGVSAAAFIIAAGAILLAWPGHWAKLWVMAPAVLFLGAHAVLCRLLTPSRKGESTPPHLVLIFDLVLLLVPGLLVATFATPGGTGGGADQLAAIGALISPVEAAQETLRSTTVPYQWLLGLILPAAMTLLFGAVAWARRSRSKGVGIP